MDFTNFIPMIGVFTLAAFFFVKRNKQEAKAKCVEKGEGEMIEWHQV